MPEETLNVLITVMSERELHVPRLERIVADPGFRLVAAMNPFDTVGTARISSAVYDRVCRLAVGYQSAAEEVAIVQRTVPEADPSWVERVVELVRRTRDHPELRVGSSVRGALDATAVVASLTELRGQPATQYRRRSGCGARGAVRAGPVARGRPAHRRGDHHGAVARGVRRSPAPVRTVSRRRREKRRPRRGPSLPEGGAGGGGCHRGCPTGDHVPTGNWPANPSSPRCRRVSVSSTSRRSPTRSAVDPDAAMALLADMTRATDARLRELARQLAARLVLDVARRGPARRRGTGRIVSAPFDVAGGDLDVDASSEAIVESRAAAAAVDPERLRIRRWVQPRTALCLLVDRSGSMGGKPLATSAVTAAAVAFRAPDDFSVVSFSKGSVVVKAQDVAAPVEGRGRRRAGAARSRDDRPRRRARRGGSATGPVECGPEGGDPAVGLPADRGRRRGGRRRRAGRAGDHRPRRRRRCGDRAGARRGCCAHDRDRPDRRRRRGDASACSRSVGVSRIGCVAAPMRSMEGPLVAAVIASAARQHGLISAAQLRSTRRQPPPPSNGAARDGLARSRSRHVRFGIAGSPDSIERRQMSGLLCLGTDGCHQPRSGGLASTASTVPDRTSSSSRCLGSAAVERRRSSSTPPMRLGPPDVVTGERVPVHVGDPHDHRSRPCPHPDGAARSCDRLGSAQRGQLAGGACRAALAPPRAGTVGRRGPR